MSSLTKSFDFYTIFYYARKSTDTTAYIANIACYKASASVGTILFHPDGSTLPANTINADGTIGLHYEMKRFNDIITILRYEKPLQIWVDTGSGAGCILTDGSEPVGEQEGV
jgi:hypothetical protein